MQSVRRQTLAVMITAIALIITGAAGAAAAGAHRQTSDVYLFEDMSDAGDASLTRTAAGVTANVHTTVQGELFDFALALGVDWERGDATTVWFVVFNDPAECDGGCGEDEVIDAALGIKNDAGVGVHYGTGHVAGGSNFNAAATLAEGDDSGALFGEPLWDAHAAEIHLIVRSHGSAADLSGPELAAALHSVDGGCGTNTCGDSQFAVFPAP